MSELVTVDCKHVFGDTGFPLDVSSWIDHGDYPRHIHDFSEIAIIMEGSGTTEVDGQLFHCHTGDVFVLHGNRPHAYLDTDHLGIINITYNPQIIGLDQFDSGLLPGYQALFVVEPALRSRSPYNRHLTLSLDQLIKVKALTDLMEKELHARQPGCQLMAVGHFMILVTLLSRYYSESEAPDTRKALQLGKALSYLEKHFMEEVQIENLAKISGMSRRSFFRAFSEVTGQTPLAYLMRLRIMKAVEMLEMTDKNITETAFDCGFQDSNYFSRQFKKIMGHTPSDFQKKYSRIK
ncbi:helix-turn-helix domain-containing protein [Tichowtungia aerotolerans]|uniref:Helix-turn-helix domain-containing protein n=1 Tax=Tichowtungia aerotolerans TaxID=2697043 RepID=A0A6P1M275_9BACT|nr:helix-turn-helix domain-containing protein [Tichowtungia aerotolerans]QHI68690.1 helix-turn-helix domain-containing protein [Tichowtungia aerotolerans]